MKTYTYAVVIEEGNDEFWEQITAGGKSGCDDLRQEIQDALLERGFASGVYLQSYRDKMSLA